MKHLFSFLTATLMLFFIADTQAATFKLTWTHPTTRENGATLAPTEIASYRIEWRTSDKVKGGAKAVVAKMVNGKWILPAAYTLTVVDWSTKKYEIRILTVDKNGLMSSFDKVPWLTVNTIR